MNQRPVTMKLWDLCQGRFYNENYLRATMRRCPIMVIAFSLTDRESFSHLFNWFQRVLHVQQRYIEHHQVRLCLVGFKADLVEDRVISRAEIEAITSEHGCPYFEVSSKARLGMQELFSYLAQSFLESYDDEEEEEVVKKGIQLKKSDRKCVLM